MPENKQRQQNKTTNHTRNVICLYKYILIIQLYIYFLTKIGKNIKNSNRHKKPYMIINTTAILLQDFGLASSYFVVVKNAKHK